MAKKKKISRSEGQNQKAQCVVLIWGLCKAKAKRRRQMIDKSQFIFAPQFSQKALCGFIFEPQFEQKLLVPVTGGGAGGVEGAGGVLIICTVVAVPVEDDAHIKAPNHPISVQPNKIFNSNIPPKLGCFRLCAIYAGKKYRAMPKTINNKTINSGRP